MIVHFSDFPPGFAPTAPTIANMSTPAPEVSKKVGATSQTPVGAAIDGRPPLPSPEFLEQLQGQSLKLEKASPREIIGWAVENYFPKLTMATAFGPEGCVIIHYLAEIEPRTPVFNLDTGYQFPETLAMRDRIAQALWHRRRIQKRRHDRRTVRSATRRAGLQDRSRTNAASIARSRYCARRPSACGPG